MPDAAPPPPPQSQPPTQKGGSPRIYFGIGCAALALLAVVGFVVAMQWGIRKTKAGIEQLKATAAEFEKNPARTAAELAVKADPDLELLSSDEARKEITFRVKKTGGTGTISYEDAARGKFVVEVGKTSFRPGQNVPLPAWVPVFPGLETAEGSMRTVSAGRESVRLLATIDQPVEIVAAFYNKGFEEAGLTVTSQQQTAGAFATHMLQARDDARHRTATVSITHEKKNAPTSVVLAVEGPVAGK